MIAIGVDVEGYREVLGVSEGTKEDAESWRTFLRSLKERGLSGVQRQVPGAGGGAGRVFPGRGLATLRGALVPQRDDGGAAGEGARGGGDAQGDPRPGGPAKRRAEGGAGGREAGGDEAAPSRVDRARGRGGDALLHGVPA
ncbi:MAG: transposase [Phycisphaerales bacterium]|nr:transposase [Phycisphaerales bacterium]